MIKNRRIKNNKYRNEKHYLLPQVLELLFLSSTLREVLGSLELGSLLHLLGLSSLFLELELLVLVLSVLWLMLK